MYSPRVAASERLDSPKPNNNNKDLGPRPTTYGGCEERGRNRARERLPFSSIEDEENEKNSAITRQDKSTGSRKDDKENFAVPLTPGIRTPRPKGVKTPYQQLMVPPSKPRSPLMAKQLIPTSLDDTCKSIGCLHFFSFKSLTYGFKKNPQNNSFKILVIQVYQTLYNHVKFCFHY